VYPLVKSFDDTVKTEAIGVRVNKDEVKSVNAKLQQMFPIDSKGIAYVSFVEGLSDSQLKRLYNMQNQWLCKVQTNPIGDFWNIDQKYPVEADQEMSL
jgi:hypothetical protein